MLISPKTQLHDNITSAQLDKYETVRNATLALVKPLSEADCTVQSMPDASPMKWHLAHTSWFFETFVLTPYLPSYQAFNPAYKVLFNSYYHAVGAARGADISGACGCSDAAFVDFCCFKRRC
jgi:DinB superfamily